MHKKLEKTKDVLKTVMQETSPKNYVLSRYEYIIIGMFWWSYDNKAGMSNAVSSPNFLMYQLNENEKYLPKNKRSICDNADVKVSLMSFRAIYREIIYDCIFYGLIMAENFL